jgi:hypothetical protein
MRNAIILFFGQILAYSVCCFSYRVLAQGNMPLSILSDIAYASLMFTLIKRVATSDGSWLSGTAYVSGSAIGTAIAIVASKAVTGK